MINRVKICGITTLEDALYAAEQGADALGFVFYPPSPRAITPEKAAEIIRKLPPFVTTVGLFVNEKIEVVERVIRETSLNLLQFHGDESPEYCGQFDRPYMKAVRMKPEVDLIHEAEKYSDASALLVDAYRPGVPGGTGETFDWERIPENLPLPLVLAGGLSAENVGDAIQQIKPWAVDVSGGVEKEQQKGMKDQEKILKFLHNTRRNSNWG